MIINALAGEIFTGATKGISFLGIPMPTIALGGVMSWDESMGKPSVEKTMLTKEREGPGIWEGRILEPLF